jgi:DNA topoisomerase-3
MAKEPDSGERDYAAYLEALCRSMRTTTGSQWHASHLASSETPTLRDPWRFGGVQTPTLAILVDLEQRIRDFVPQDYYKIALLVRTESGAEVTLWHAPKTRSSTRRLPTQSSRPRAAGQGPLSVEQKDVRRSPSPSVLEGHAGAPMR